MKLFVALLGLFITQPILADSLSLELGLYTRHIHYQEGSNEDNKLIGIEYKHKRLYFNASRFTNTYSDTAWTIGSGYNIIDYAPARFDVLGGVAYGYDKMKFLPYVAPRITLYHKIDKVTFKISAQQFWDATEITSGIEIKF